MTDVALALLSDVTTVSSALSTHIADTTNPHSVTKAQVGLGNADNTADLDKPISTATQTALDAKQDLDATLTALAGLTTAANQMVYATGVDAFAMTSLTAFARSILDDADEAAFKATVNLEIGTDVQAQDDLLQSFADLSPSPNTYVYFGGGGAFSTDSITSFGRSLLDDANASTARSTLGLVIGTDVQAYDADTAKLDVAQAFTAAQTFTGGIILETGTAPTPTTDGQVAWDTDDDILVIGDGSGQQIFYPQSTGSFTGTLTGCTTSPTGTIDYALNGDQVILSVPTITGTSNDTTATITGLPTTLYPASTNRVKLIRVQENGTVKVGLAVVQTDGVISLYSAADASVFTASGAKGVYNATIAYNL